MFCSNCGYNNNNGVKFCARCGAKQESEKKSGKGIVIVLSVLLGIAVVVLAGLIVWLNFYKSPNGKGDLTAGGGSNAADADYSLGEHNGAEIKPYDRPMLLGIDDLSEDNVVPEANALELKPSKGLSNVSNTDQFYLDEDSIKHLEEDGFCVSQAGGNEFFGTYETNRYLYTPNFVTVDSLMHTYHLYFQNLLKNTEKKYLAEDLSELSDYMLEKAIDQYEYLEGTEWEEAAKRNIAFFGVAAYLQDSNVEIPECADDIIKGELSLIKKAEGISESPIFGSDEDYSQYLPRGYYEGDEQLEKYFRAMMWYGRRAFEQRDEESNRSALLISISIDQDSYEEWEEIYAVTSFFAGASDDLGYCEYMPIIKAVYGDNVRYETLIGNDKAFSEYQDLVKKLNPPMINSIVINEGESNQVSSFRFMGQRFTIDAAIMQQLIYQNVKENSNGERRMLPDVLDVAATLGSDTAYELLDEQGDTGYKYYPDNLNKMKDIYTNAPKKAWNASLYSGWLNTLRPVLEKKGKGYPYFMQTEEWNKKELETFAGSYAELKHDTILYAKQVMAEMGDGEIPVYDDRGYVEPQPLVFFRFKALAQKTREGLDSFGMLDSEDSENLKRLAELADRLYTISCKELTNEKVTDDEFELIRTYGGQLEHFWHDATVGLTGDEDANTDVYPCPIVADIATDPNGQVLEVGTGRACDITVIVPVEGKLKLAVGTVYSFYQFTQPISGRLTDSKWRQMLGCEVDGDGNYSYDEEPDQPWWTQSYRKEKWH